MPSLDTAAIVVAGIALLAAFVNGALGYGFSSLTVPLALVFYTNRILNPAVIVIEVFLNLYVLFINRDGLPAVLSPECRADGLEIYSGSPALRRPSASLARSSGRRYGIWFP